MTHQAPKIEYRHAALDDGKYGVFAVHSDRPEWWRCVAVFLNQTRAEQYAEVEAMMAGDIGDIEWAKMQAEEIANPPPIPEPSSSITVGNFVRREAESPPPTETPEEEYELSNEQLGALVRERFCDKPKASKEITPSPNNSKAITHEKTPEEVSPKKPREPEGDLIDASTLPPLTVAQAKVFRGLAAALAECEPDERPTFSDIIRHSEVSGVASYLPQLAAKGYVENRGEYGAPDWRVLARGEPIVELPKDSRGRVVRQWTEQEVEGLEALKPGNGDTYATYAEKIDRTVDAVMQKARGRGCYNVALVPGYFPQAEPQKPPAPVLAVAHAQRCGRRFTDHPELDPASVRGLAPDHPAIRESRTLFPSSVVSPADSERLLISGKNSRKLGDIVRKGPWTGFPIFQLTLEERATCPKSCAHWLTCFGNATPFARRHRHDTSLRPKLYKELFALQQANPKGFAVRLHVLGDFFSVDYVNAWEHFLATFPALHIFGYTAWPKDTPIGKAIAKLADAQWSRFAIRFSSATPQPQGATTIWRKPEGKTVPEGIVCPAQTEATAACATCALCWSEAARDKTIVFVGHGGVGKGGRKPEFGTRKLPVAAKPDALKAPAQTKVSYPVVRRIDNTKPKLLSPDTRERRLDELGDPIPGRSAADNDFDPKTYLIKKGHTVSLQVGGALLVDGKRYEREEVIDLVNSHRAKADLPPLQVGATA